MPVQSHLVELERKHHALETELTIALAHPSSDDLKIAELKRKKLLLKDEIARLKSTERLH
ncbi:YdcH family protein [Labrys sp. KB_33_2]|uniref:YdcH family protein n=1 Tax=unclassified Labrys (in: a-proteobacteria) TaxID=2688601 RepID=UPI003EBA176C